MLEETNKYKEEGYDAVTTKNPKILDTEAEPTSEDSTTAEEIDSEDGTEQTEDDSPQYMNPSEDSDI